MRWVTKAALVSFGISVVGIYLERWFEPLFTVSYVFIILAFILALLAILETPSAEGNSYLFSILSGIAVGFIIGYIFFTSWAEVFPISVTLGSSIEKDEIPTLIFVSNVPPILVMIYSLLLSRVHPYAWKEIRVRLISIALLLLLYPLGSYFSAVISVSGASLSRIFLAVPYILPALLSGAPYIFPRLLSAGISGIEMMFIYSNIVTIATAYIATIGIKDLRRRAILTLGLILLMSIVASSPLTLALIQY